MGGLISALCKLYYTSIGTPLNLENLNKKLVSDPTHTLIFTNNNWNGNTFLFTAYYTNVSSFKSSHCNRYTHALVWFNLRVLQIVVGHIPKTVSVVSVELMPALSSTSHLYTPSSDNITKSIIKRLAASLSNSYR